MPQVASRERTAMVMEYSKFVSYAASRLHPAIRAEEGAAGASRANPNGDLYRSAQFVVFNLPADGRLDRYTDSNYDAIQVNKGRVSCVLLRRLMLLFSMLLLRQAYVVTFASRLLFEIGFNLVEVEVPILDEVTAYCLFACLPPGLYSLLPLACAPLQLFGRRFVSLYLGLVLDILLFILFALSTLLIYSLLMINVQNRTFELAIRRMIGTTRPTLVLLLVTQVGVVDSWRCVCPLCAPHAPF